MFLIFPLFIFIKNINVMRIKITFPVIKIKIKTRSTQKTKRSFFQNLNYIFLKNNSNVNVDIYFTINWRGV